MAILRGKEGENSISSWYWMFFRFSSHNSLPIFHPSIHFLFFSSIYPAIFHNCHTIFHPSTHFPSFLIACFTSKHPPMSHCPCPNVQAMLSITATAHLHTTEVALYPIFFSPVFGIVTPLSFTFLIPDYFQLLLYQQKNPFISLFRFLVEIVSNLFRYKTIHSFILTFISTLDIFSTHLKSITG